jgi:hypothetical protein
VKSVIRPRANATPQKIQGSQLSGPPLGIFELLRKRPRPRLQRLNGAYVHSLDVLGRDREIVVAEA